MSFRTHKLSKSRSNARLDDPRRESGHTFKASIEDLRNPDGRTSLRNHFTGAFPEAQVRPSLESMHSWETDSRPALSRSTSYTTTPRNPSALASSQSSDSLTARDPRRLSIVQEQNGAMDVSSAIKLLEELKKTATAAELVALHKALLPSRSPQPSDDAMPGLIRRASMMPPGIATRNASGDLLKTPEEAAAETRAKRRPSTHHRTMTEPMHSLQDRPATPDYFNVHMGAYEPGTLRITNGAASPAPSTLRDVDRYETAPSTPMETDFVRTPTAVEHNEFRLDNSMAAKIESHQSRPTTRDGPRKLQKADKTLPKRSRRSSEPSQSAIPAPSHERIILSPRVYRPSRPEKQAKSREESREPSQSRTRSWLGRSRRSSSARRSPQVDANAEQSEPSRGNHVSHNPLRIIIDHEAHPSESSSAHTDTMSPTAADMLRPNLETDLPRFAQRLSYRMSQLPPDAAQNAQLPSNPDDNTAALASLSQRLSSVSSRHSGINQVTAAAGHGNAAAALARLNGSDQGQISEKLFSMGAANVVDPAIAMHSRRSIADAADSGYSSEFSNSVMHLKQAREEVQEQGPHTNGDGDQPITFTARKSLAGASGELSLCSFNTILKSSAMLSGEPTTSTTPLRDGKKPLTILGISITKKGGGTSTHVAPAGLLSSTDIVPSSSDHKMQKKKLQKEFPASVKKELKAQKKQVEAARQFNEPVNVPAVPEKVQSSFRRHSREMDSRPNLSASQYFGTDPSDYVMDRPSELSGSREIPQIAQPVATPAAAIMRRRSHTVGSQSTGSEATIVPRGHARFKERLTHIRNNSLKRSVDITPGPIEFGDNLLPEDPDKVDASKSHVGMDDVTATLFARRRSRDVHLAKTVLSRPELNRMSSSVYDAVTPPTPPTAHAIGAKMSKRHELAGSGALSNGQADLSGVQPQLSAAVGYATESVAEAVKRTAENRQPAGYSTESVADAIRKMQNKSDRKSKSKKKAAKRQIRQDHVEGIDVSDQAEKPQDMTKPTETHVPEHADIPEAWQDQARTWRKRRQSAGDGLIKSELEEQAPTQRNRASTSSVHTIPRKPLRSTRNSAEPDTSHQQSVPAGVQAEVYRDLINNANIDRPTYDGVGWRDSSGTFATVHDDSEGEEEEDRVDSALSSRPPTSISGAHTNSQLRQSTDSEMIRQYRDHSLAKLTGTPTNSAKPSFEMPRRPRQRHDGLNSLIIGRYSGGSELGYDGLGGSAGLRGLGNRGTGLGLNLFEKGGLWGVDLSDVPVLPMSIPS